MKYLFLILCFQCLPNFLAAQIIPINLGTTEDVGKFIKIGTSIILHGNNNLALISSDGFNTYTSINLPSNPSWNNLLKAYDGKLFLMSAAIGAGTKIWISHDTGLTWQLRKEILNTHGDSFAMFDTSAGFMVGSIHKKYSTTNGWITCDTGSFYSVRNDDTESDLDSTVIVCISGGIKYSKDRGKTFPFFPLSTGGGSGSTIYFNDLRVPNKDTFYAVGFSISGVTGFFYSLYGSDSLHLNYSLNTQNPYFIYGLGVISKDEIYGVGKAGFNGVANGAIMKTTDLGLSWQIYNTNINLGFDEILEEMIFLNDSIALIAGSNGLLLKWNKNTLVTSIVQTEKPHTNLSIYPNPANDFITINYISNTTNKIDIFIQDGLGKTISQKKLLAKQGSNPFFWNISNLAAGLYFVTINEDGHQTNRKFIKQ